MTLWLVANSVRRAPRRLVLGAIGVAFPVAMLAATLFFVDHAVRAMTPAVLRPIQVEMRGLATSLNVDLRTVSRQLASAAPGIRRVEPFAAADVVIGTPGVPGMVTARLFAVDPTYLENHSWLRVTSGSLTSGALLDESLRAAPGFGSATTLTIGLPGDAPALSLTVPASGTIDLRQASTWFSIPYGEVQGDVVTLPRAFVIDYATFERSLLPVLRSWAAHGGIPVFDPGSADLPPVSLEAHVSVDHAAYPSDPGAASSWSSSLRRILERAAPGSVLVADNAAEDLTMAKADATNAKILFLLLGIPGVLVAAALGMAAASALAEAHRREEALLRLRGATAGQIARLAAAQAAIAGFTGAVLGLVAAALAVSAVIGTPIWRDVPAGRLVFSALLGVGAGALTTAVRLVRLRRASKESEVALDRRLLERGWSPVWRRARLDLVALGVGVLILLVNVLTGGLRHSPIEGPTLALSFYVLLAPIALWLGVTLLVVRWLLALLGRLARPEESRPLPSWRGAAVRWLGRRPARTGVALVLGALAVAFGTYVLGFAATYRTAERADAQAAIGSDLRLTPGDPTFTLPPLGSDVAGVSALRIVPARVGSDRKTILAIDPATYSNATTTTPDILSGGGLADLVKDPLGVLVANEIAVDFSLHPGDTLPAIIFPDDFEANRSLSLHVVGVFRSFPPTAPVAELVVTTAAIPPSPVIPPPDFYLARVSHGRSPVAVADQLRRGPLTQRFGVSTIAGPNKRGLTALNLGGLSRIESLGGGLIAAVGVAVLGAFLVLERRREFAILRAVGAERSQILSAPTTEGLIAVFGSLVVGVPLGLGLGVLAVRILGLFFTLSPPLLSVPGATLGGLVAFMIATSTIALGAALVAVNRVRAATVLRES